MKRVVVTGLGITSCLGTTAESVLASLKETRSGIQTIPEYIEKGMRSHVAGRVDIDLSERIDRKLWRFMGDAAGYAFVAMEDAIADAGLESSDVSNVRTGIIAGSAVRAVCEAAGVKNILTKSFGSNNPVTLVKATIEALQHARTKDDVERLRGVQL
jgi:3-oxoacyl-(acyl-carrier-protein) synthase